MWGKWGLGRESRRRMSIWKSSWKTAVINGSEASIVIKKLIDYELNQKPGDWKKTSSPYSKWLQTNKHPPPRYGGHCSYIAGKTLSSNLKTLSRDLSKKKWHSPILARSEESTEEAIRPGTCYFGETMLVTANETTAHSWGDFSRVRYSKLAKQEQLALLGYRYLPNLQAR